MSSTGTLRSTSGPTTCKWTISVNEFVTDIPGHSEGQARVTLFAAQSNARTFDYQSGDIGYVPASYGHYVENTGNTTLRFLEIYKTGQFLVIYLQYDGYLTFLLRW